MARYKVTWLTPNHFKLTLENVDADSAEDAIVKARNRIDAYKFANNAELLTVEKVSDGNQ